MSKFENIAPENIKVWYDDVTGRIMGRADINGDWHEVAFGKGSIITMQEMINVLKEDLREPK